VLGMIYLKNTKIIILSTIFFVFAHHPVIAEINTSPNSSLDKNNQAKNDNYNLDSGNNYALKICENYRNNQLKNSCQDIVNNASFLDIKAVNLCEYKFAISEDTLNCLASISGKNYQDQELVSCLNSETKYTIYQCLSQGGKLGKTETLDTENDSETTTTFQPIEQNSGSICDFLKDSPNLKECNQIIAKSYFLDLSAINLCENKIKAIDKVLRCLESISNKIYSPTEINQCNKIRDENQLINCLMTAGESMDSLDQSNQKTPSIE
jgi:hypothetical protein